MRFEYPSQLPVSTARDDIAEAVRASQVVIISGQTGSGKTTQLPKILLELGRGSHGRQIVHTQPRRLAARTVAERIASEMGVKLGEEVGYQVRFTDESSPKTRLRVVTDGILLAQIQRDPKLMQYDTIVIDEAHERSLNIDFLLGYLTALLPKRRDSEARHHVRHHRFGEVPGAFRTRAAYESAGDRSVGTHLPRADRVRAVGYRAGADALRAGLRNRRDAGRR